MGARTRSGSAPLEHEGEMGCHVWAPDLEGLFQTAADALYRLIRSEFTLREPHQMRLDLEEPDPALLLRAFLAELVYELSAHQRVFPRRRFRVLTPSRLTADLVGGRYDPQSEPLDREVKAVTYYRLRVWREPPGWHATFIVDV